MKTDTSIRTSENSPVAVSVTVALLVGFLLYLIVF